MDSHVVRLVDGLDNLVVILSVCHEIDIIRIQNQDTHIVLLLDEVEITLLQMLEIRIVDLLLVIAATLMNVILQMLDIEIEIHHQLGLRDIRENDIEKP